MLDIILTDNIQHLLIILWKILLIRYFEICSGVLTIYPPLPHYFFSALTIFNFACSYSSRLIFSFKYNLSFICSIISCINSLLVCPNITPPPWNNYMPSVAFPCVTRLFVKKRKQSDMGTTDNQKIKTNLFNHILFVSADSDIALHQLAKFPHNFVIALGVRQPVGVLCLVPQKFCSKSKM